MNSVASLPTHHRRSLWMIVFFSAVAVGSVNAGVRRIYDAPNWQAAVTLATISTWVAVIGFWVGLAVSKGARQERAAAACLATVPWTALQLSSLAYVGFIFIPIEIVAAYFILRKTSKQPSGWGRMALCALVRLLALAAVAAARPLVRHLWPWGAS